MKYEKIYKHLSENYAQQHLFFSADEVFHTDPAWVAKCWPQVQAEKSIGYR